MLNKQISVLMINYDKSRNSINLEHLNHFFTRSRKKTTKYTHSHMPCDLFNHLISFIRNLHSKREEKNMETCGWQHVNSIFGVSLFCGWRFIINGFFSMVNCNLSIFIFDLLINWMWIDFSMFVVISMALTEYYTTDNEIQRRLWFATALDHFASKFYLYRHDSMIRTIKP